ncbi:hypothetical protein [Herbiconiux moechotypicola]|uniref:oxidoreductase n=1 Tax=Herbiconiux moechotypicola TaxID=637393 RepID=UPI002877EA10|nr:hypothetical protein [Herbiconiux moechotypicola]
MSSLLFAPLSIRGVSFANRLWVSPMCQYSAVDGLPQEWHAVHLGALAVGGPGLVMAEATAVRPEGRITPVCTGIWNAEQQGRWARITAFARSQGVPMGLQLAHAGRKASTASIADGSGPVAVADGGWPTVAPSAVPYGDYAVPESLTVSQIGDVVRSFGEAARRAEDAGFAVVEIHAAHGYLLHEFLSPLANHRTDGYGSSPEGRARMLFEVVEDVRRAVSPGSTRGRRSPSAAGIRWRWPGPCARRPRCPSLPWACSRRPGSSRRCSPRGRPTPCSWGASSCATGCSCGGRPWSSGRRWSGPTSTAWRGSREPSRRQCRGEQPYWRGEIDPNGF